jgi:hypothetical protein
MLIRAILRTITAVAARICKISECDISRALIVDIDLGDSLSNWTKVAVYCASIFSCFVTDWKGLLLPGIADDFLVVVVTATRVVQGVRISCCGSKHRPDAVVLGCTSEALMVKVFGGVVTVTVLAGTVTKVVLVVTDQKVSTMNGSMVGFWL